MFNIRAVPTVDFDIQLDNITRDDSLLLGLPSIGRTQASNGRTQASNERSQASNGRTQVSNGRTMVRTKSLKA
jgi:hypothetical protein